MSNSGKAITIMIKKSYGRTCYYPVCDDAKLFAQIAGNRTLTLANIKHIQALGYLVCQQVEEADAFPVAEGKS